jgi:cell division inhibitor SulA
MPSVMKVSAEVSPRAIREVDRHSRNPESSWLTWAAPSYGINNEWVQAGYSW